MRRTSDLVRTSFHVDGAGASNKLICDPLWPLPETAMICRVGALPYTDTHYVIRSSLLYGVNALHPAHLMYYRISRSPSLMTARKERKGRGTRVMHGRSRVTINGRGAHAIDHILTD